MTPFATTSGSRDDRTGFVRLWVLTTVVQLGLVSWTFPVGELLSDTPHTHIDHPVHLQRVMLAADLAQQGLTRGYDPFFAAGSPAGMPWNPAAKIPALMAIAGIEPVVAWKLYTFLAAVLAPGLLVVAARLLRLPPLTALWTTLLGLILWWTSMFRWFHTAGLVSFVFASYLGILYLALLHRYPSGRSTVGEAALLGLLGGISTIVHPLFPVIVLPAGLAILWFRRREYRPFQFAVLALSVPAIVLAMNWFWFYNAFVEHLYDAPPYGIHQARVDASMIWKEAIGIWKGPYHGSKAYPLILLALLLAWWRRPERRHLTSCRSSFTAGGIALVLYGAFGASVPAAAALTQPNRFAVTGYLLLALPAATGLSHLGKGMSRLLPRWPARLATLALLALLLVCANEIRRELSYRPIGHYGMIPPEVRGLGDRSTYILRWLEEHTSPEARVLFETSHARIHDGGHMAGLLALSSRREFIGGPYVLQYHAGFWDHTVFGREITEQTPERFTAHLRLYNIGWIIAHHPVTIEWLDRVPGIRKVDEYRGLAFYETDTRTGYFIEGSGRVVERGVNRLVLDGLHGTRVLIRYHYMKGLRCSPRCEIVPRTIGEDPTPFIELRSPPESVVIHWGKGESDETAAKGAPAS